MLTVVLAVLLAVAVVTSWKVSVGRVALGVIAYVLTIEGFWAVGRMVWRASELRRLQAAPRAVEVPRRVASGAAVALGTALSVALGMNQIQFWMAAAAFGCIIGVLWGPAFQDVPPDEAPRSTVTRP